MCNETWTNVAVAVRKLARLTFWSGVECSFQRTITFNGSYTQRFHGTRPFTAGLFEYMFHLLVRRR